MKYLWLPAILLATVAVVGCQKKVEPVPFFSSTEYTMDEGNQYNDCPNPECRCKVCECDACDCCLKD